MRSKLFAFAVASIVVTGIAAGDLQAGRRDKLVDSREYKDDDFEKGIIEDYSDMVEGDGVEWYYKADGFKLSDYKVKIGKFKNMSDITSKSMVETLEESLPESIERAGGKGSRGTLTTENAVYWAERASAGKKWIPYAGFHVGQAGVGVEMIFKDSSGKIVAKIRHSGRQGENVEEAAEEIADDIANWLSEN
jgi:hypothetical protein